MSILTVGSAVLAVVNIAVMWGMAHRWRYAWHGNLGLQLLWLPYDAITKQYGLFALGAVMTVVSIKGCLHKGEGQSATEARSGPRHRRPRRGRSGGRIEQADVADQARPQAPAPTSAPSPEVAAASAPPSVRYRSTASSAMLARRADRRRQLRAGLAHRRNQVVHPDRPVSRPMLQDVPDSPSRSAVSR